MTDLDYRPATLTADHGDLLARGSARLRQDDPELYGLLSAEIAYERATLPMVAYASLADPSVLSAAGSALANVTAEGYPGARYHPGAGQFDGVERLAIERAKAAFGAKYANVQPHSCSSANLAILMTLLNPGDTMLSLDLDSGGHLTHGAKASVTGRYYNAVHYGLDEHGFIDYDAAERLAKEYRPKLIIAGASAYPRAIDYVRFRRIADSVAALLLADISHIAGLVATGELASPVDVAHITTCSTYKQLGGPRGGIILLGDDHDVVPPGHKLGLAALVQRGIFPKFQGTPSPAAIAAKARALDLVARPKFAEMTRRIALDARALAAALTERGWRVLTGGTDNHIVLVDTFQQGLTGVVAEAALQECGVLANKNRIANDTKSPMVTSGLRFGTNMLAQRGFDPSGMNECAELVDRILRAVRPLTDVEYELSASVQREVSAQVAALAAAYPIMKYAV
ncbi:serine hydroxymethyltransferase 1 [Lentzea sp. NBRC 105346]|uniref:serine hydroxymethyltransferase n=1 Tax=Lentzea sp. NBRC 105346 TaxID=3032205 RepID=UPI00249FFC5A|nr:serine hydroxymethyltransferase [Lentzea sp. NBRC 105346]GLZ32173.1 serine hydroxymethyltransferase 1 [Lentzea sp. NBRC 105346]